MGGQAKGRKNNKQRRKENRPHKDPGVVGWSPQERMKVRMHEKAKKKTAEKYSVEQLLEKTEECMCSFDFEMARLYCQRALDLDATHLRALDTLGQICCELGDTHKAKQVFLRAVELSPETGHSKFMSLGQIHSGQESVDFYTRGIQVLLSDLDTQAQNAQPPAAALLEEEPERLTKKDVCVAYCSIAEIFLTDLCMEEGAADRCHDFIQKALQVQPDHPEALQLMASYLFSAEKKQEGKDFLLRSVDSWLPAHKHAAAASSSDGGTQVDVPPYESRISTAKLLLEAEEMELAVDVLEGLLEEDDEVVQVWYLSGWACYLQLQRAREQQEVGAGGAEEEEESRDLSEAARLHLTKAKQLYGKLRCDDELLLAHVEQLLGELGGDLEGEEDAGGEEELCEPCSDDEEEEEEECAAMEQ